MQEKTIGNLCTPTGSRNVGDSSPPPKIYVQKFMEISHAIAIKALRNDHDAKDVAQEAAVVFVRKYLKEFQRRGWGEDIAVEIGKLAKAITWTICTRVRSEQSVDALYKALSSPCDVYSLGAATADTPLEALLSKEQHHIIGRMIKSILRKDQRTAMEMLYHQSLSPNEIAIKLHKTPNATRTLLFRARLKLAASFKRIRMSRGHKS